MMLLPSTHGDFHPAIICILPSTVFIPASTVSFVATASGAAVVFTLACGRVAEVSEPGEARGVWFDERFLDVWKKGQVVALGRRA